MYPEKNVALMRDYIRQLEYNVKVQLDVAKSMLDTISQQQRIIEEMKRDLDLNTNPNLEVVRENE